MKWLVLAIVVQSSCDGPCVDGVCPSFDQDARYPGPCESAAEPGNYGHHCTYRYDGPRVQEIDCRLWNDADGAGGHHTTTWMYDAAGQPARVTEVFSGHPSEFQWTWKLDTDPISYFGGPVELAAYDRATFAFLPMPGSEVLSPKASLGLVRVGDTTFTWSGSGTNLTRTSSNGSVATFELDDRGRIVRSNDGAYDSRWTFDGDLLRRFIWANTSPGGESSGEKDYVYDRLGNLVMAADEVYAYDCW